MNWLRSLVASAGLVVIGVVSAAQSEQEIIIRGGEVFTDGALRAADVRIVGATVTEIGTGLAARDADTEDIDASGLLVLPGGIDPHVHLGGIRMDDYTSGSRAALAGGITTISNFGGVADGETPAETLARATPEIEAQTIADVIFHPIVSDPASATTDSLAALAAAGQTTIKVFMVRPTFDARAPGFVTTMHAARENGVLMMMHCEDAAIVRVTSERMVAEGRGSLAYFADARPVEAEEAATQRAVAMAEATGVHRAPVVGTRPAGRRGGAAARSAGLRRDAPHLPAPDPRAVRRAHARALHRPAAAARAERPGRPVGRHRARHRPRRGDRSRRLHARAEARPGAERRAAPGR
ncbi:MAG: amidohydrolase family protein, partial [Acidobacteria bacterium]|nr:amidohydrolase family protein [Acidobacteriota bacterium]